MSDRQNPTIKISEQAHLLKEYTIISFNKGLVLISLLLVSAIGHTKYVPLAELSDMR